LTHGVFTGHKINFYIDVYLSVVRYISRVGLFYRVGRCWAFR